MQDVQRPPTQPLHPLPPLRMPGATLLTRLKVYDSAAPDGQAGGTPHCHLACSELYFVLNGTGAVEVIDADGFKRIDLSPHASFLFDAGTLHRLVNPNGDLEVLIVMQNSGLPERGDNIPIFPREVLADELAFARAMRATTLEEAARRRDLAVQGFLDIKLAFERSRVQGRSALEVFFNQSLRLTKTMNPAWYSLVANNAMTEAQTTLTNLIELSQGHVAHLFRAQHCHIPAVEAETVGFCGTLNRYFDPASLRLEGVAEGLPLPSGMPQRY